MPVRGFFPLLLAAVSPFISPDIAGDGAEGDEIARGRGVLALDTFNFFILAFWAAIKPLLRATASADLGVPLLFPVISVFGLLPPSPSYLAAFDLKSGGEEDPEFARSLAMRAWIPVRGFLEPPPLVLFLLFLLPLLLLELLLLLLLLPPPLFLSLSSVP